MRIKLNKIIKKLYSFKTIVVIVVTLNIFVLGYFYREISTIKKNLVTQVTIQPKTETEDILLKQEDIEQVNDEMAAKVEILNTDITEIRTKLKKLENGTYLIGQTLDSCSVIQEAYSGFGARPGFDDRLNNCGANYKKLQEMF